MSKRLLPLFDRVLVKRIVPATRTAGGILLPETQAKINEGVVIAVGSGARDRDGALIKPSVKEGDNVMLPEYGGNNVKIGEDELTMYRESDLLGILVKS